MSQVVIIRGPLGIGKSTIAKLVAKELNGKYYSIDSVLAENNLDKIPEGEPCISEESFIKANKIILPTLKKYLEENNAIVIDGNFYHKKALEDLLYKLKDYKKTIFTLKADLNVCIQRDSQRELSYGKGAAIAVHNLVSRFDYGHIIENNDSNIKEKIKQIMIILNK